MIAKKYLDTLESNLRQLTVVRETLKSVEGMPESWLPHPSPHGYSQETFPTGHEPVEASAMFNFPPPSYLCLFQQTNLIHGSDSTISEI